MTQVSELEFDAYNRRQYSEITREGLEKRVALLKPGNRARWTGSTWEPIAYPGFAFQAMASAHEANRAITARLEIMRDTIVSLAPEGSLYPLPSTSFHQTVINTFSAARLEENVIAKGMLDTFPDFLKEKLEAKSSAVPLGDELVIMPLIGISIFRTAIGILGIFESKDMFQRVLNVRDYAYDNPDLAEFGLVRTRPFIGHLTLSYCEADLPENVRQHLVDGIDSLNQQMVDASLPYHMPVAALHRYDSLAHFEPDPSYPVLPI